MECTFKDRRVVVTGACGIMGRRIALAFAREGAELFLSDLREPSLTDLAEEIGCGGTVVHTHAANFASADETFALCRAVERVWGGVDALINVAGLYPMRLLRDTSVVQWDHDFAVNVQAPFILTRELGGLMARGGRGGAVVNLTSDAAHRAKVGHGTYSATKAALEMLTKSFALELAPFNVRVNAVVPGFAPGSAFSARPGDYAETYTTSIPLGRDSGPEDAPAAILFLCSPQASFITGTTLTVDGGRSAGALSAQQRRELAPGAEGDASSD